MDLTTTYMGMKLAHPIVPAASPLSKNLDSIKRLVDAGAPAIVMYSLFEEQINAEGLILDHYLNYGSYSSPEAMTYFPDLKNYNIGPDDYLELIRKASERAGVPIIGSLNGVSTGGWISYAKKIEEAGAAGLELNIYYIATDIARDGNEIEQMYLDVVRDVKKSVSIPVAVKVGPFFSATANMMRKLADAGADALVLFNRFYQPDIDPETLEVVPQHILSTSTDLLVSLRWVAILYGRVPVDFAVTNGVHSTTDVLKSMMAGAKVAMVASELLQHGMGRIRELANDLQRWMEEHEYESVRQMQGSMSQINVAQPAAFERANYMKSLESWRPDPTGVKL
ncbi:MAG: dihydroorotate dehydrogenase-like protein [Anaerolineae bacterium]|nr:dihydroorotate dehydrogenase-like protein [Thermoflexales bacterium]MDW8406246.1 dihydroorotate dehydrogenase-like protein [Anaerolineae bacterium]